MSKNMNVTVKVLCVARNLGNRVVTHALARSFTRYLSQTIIPITAKVFSTLTFVWRGCGGCAFSFNFKKWSHFPAFLYFLSSLFHHFPVTFCSWPVLTHDDPVCIADILDAARRRRVSNVVSSQKKKNSFSRESVVFPWRNTWPRGFMLQRLLTERFTQYGHAITCSCDLSPFTLEYTFVKPKMQILSYFNCL